MEGLTASELTMIRRLSGNDPVIRKKTVKKLKQWLTAILRRVPDNPNCRELIENNFLRVWKALFYCMWMADKPLPQEQLAEQISSLIEVFSSKPHVMNLFIEHFFRTMAREWLMIDKFRMDKFMMLIRRFLRKALMALSENQWKVDGLEGFLRIISVNIFNRHPEIKQTRSKARDPSPEKTPLGLQIHIVDIFLEELAKVGGGENLSSKKILRILGPFINELSTNDDDRLLTEIRERIFCHLMRQSDVGIDYAEGVLGDIDEEGEEELEDENSESDADMENEQEKSSRKKKSKRNGNDNNTKNDDEDEDDYLNMDEGESSLSVQAGPFDPRAGAVDVILPQLEIDYKELSEKLIEAGGAKEVKMKNRKMLYKLAKKFQKLIEGEYPLAVEVEDTRKPAIANKDIKAATERLIELEESAANPDRKNRKPKKVRKKLLAQKQKEMELLENSMDSSLDGSDASIYLQDKELLDHVGDNYMSYLEELHQEQDDGESIDEDEDEDEEAETTLDSDNDEKEEDENQFNLSGDEEDEENDTEAATSKNSISIKKDKKKKKGKNVQGSDSIDEFNSSLNGNNNNSNNNNNSLLKTKNKNKKNKTSPPEVSVSNKNEETPIRDGNEENHVTKSTNSTVASPSILRGKNKKSNNNNNNNNTSCFSNNSSPDLGKSNGNGNEEAQTGEQFITIPSPSSSTPNRPKKRKLSESFDLAATPTTPKENKLAAKTPSTTPSNKRKRVTIVLARNLHHEHSDYKESIQRSPAIPYSPEVTPKFGLLKSPKTPSASPMFRKCVTGLTSRRASGKF